MFLSDVRLLMLSRVALCVLTDEWLVCFGDNHPKVSELALGTQRWYSSDFNAPNEAQCQAFMDRAILGSGVNLIDTAEQYPIPSDDRRPEGFTEEAIGRWMAKDQGEPLV